MNIRFGLMLCFLAAPLSVAAGSVLDAEAALKRATQFLRSIDTHGGYVGIYSLDLKERFGEATYEEADENEIWVQPPGTPSVGEAFLRAYRVTEDPLYFEAARDAGRALAWGQRKEGGWDHRVEVDHLTPDATVPERQSGHGTFDDEITQGALRFLMELNEVIDESWLDDSIELGLDYMIEAQYENGAWPQWYPLRGGYHDYATFNDAAINDCITLMLEAYDRYGDPRYLKSAEEGGQFIIRSQGEPPQAGWAQQYALESQNSDPYSGFPPDIQPAWARSFEPVGVCSLVTARNIRTLLRLYRKTGDRRYLKPIPKAIDWLERSQLDNGQWARLYEIGSNKPIYGDRTTDRKVFHDYSKVSQEERSSYGWQGGFGIEGAIHAYQRVARDADSNAASAGSDQDQDQADRKPSPQLKRKVKNVINSLDAEGRWITEKRLEIGTFVENINLLCRYLEAKKK